MQNTQRGTSMPIKQREESIPSFQPTVRASRGPRLNTALCLMRTSMLLVLVGLFALSVVVAIIAGTERLFGYWVAIAGLAVIWFSKAMAANVGPRAASSPWLLFWRNARPLTFRLWGAGLMLLGIASLVLVRA